MSGFASPFTLGACQTVTLTNFDNTQFSHRERPILIAARLGNMKSPTGPIPTPLAMIDMVTRKEFPMEGMDKGHLIARRFVGAAADQAFNLVPLQPSFNRKGGLWSSLEEELAKLVGQGITLTIDINYATPIDLIPSSLIVTAALDDGGYASFKGLPLNRASFNNLATLPVQMNPLKMIEEYGLGEQGMQIIADILKAKDVDPGSYDFVALHAQSKPYVGGDPKERLYSFLDRLYIDRGSDAVHSFVRATISPGRGFSDDQRFLIKVTNRLRHDGWLISDDLTDVHAGKPLAEGSSPISANIDHAWPEAKAGWNCFSNARLTSEAANKTKLDTL